MEVYNKINTMYRRYIFDGKNCPNKKWLKWKNKIILHDFSDKTAEYLFNCPWEATSKVDGTNSKIAFFPSTQEIMVGGKTDKAKSQHGQFEMLQEIAERIKPMLCELFPKESARFAQVKNSATNKVQYYDTYADNGVSDDNGNYDVFFVETNDPKDISEQMFYGVKLEEVPIYIYGEYYGQGIQKCGSRYIKDGNDFLVFDIRRQGWWLPKAERDALCEKLGLRTVPYIGVFTLAEIEKMVIDGFPTKVPNAKDPTMIEEGIVAKPILPLLDERGNRIIVKVKYCDYVDYYSVRNEFTDEEFAEFSKWYSENEGKL